MGVEREVSEFHHVNVATTSGVPSFRRHLGTIAFFGMTFIEAVAVTKVLNVFSSSVATVVFAVQGLIDWRLGLLLGLLS